MVSVDLRLGDCLEIMKEIPTGSITAVVTDPPAGISFMGKSWDRDKGGRDNWIAWMEQVARECLRLIKPGGHALVWALPRTSHWTATAWENAGWEVRDRIAFAFGSGFPKALDVGKAIDAMAGETPSHDGYLPNGKNACYGAGFGGGTKTAITAPSTEAAKQWDGWKSALKPAIEDWWLFRKPLDGTIAENVLKYGVGALNIDGCRVESGTDYTELNVTQGGDHFSIGSEKKSRGTKFTPASGRYPSHLIHDGSEEVVMCFPETTSGVPGIRRKEHETTAMSGRLAITGKQESGFADSGSASRFFQCCPFEEEDFEATRLFYTAKAGKSDRNEGCEELEEREGGIKNTSGRGFSESDPMPPVLNRNIHPTVKSLSLMRYLCKLITPPCGTVLDCFLGSGSTGKAARLEGFDFIGIEQDADYFEIAKKRIEHADRKARGVVREPVPGGVQVGLFDNNARPAG